MSKLVIGSSKTNIVPAMVRDVSPDCYVEYNVKSNYSSKPLIADSDKIIDLKGKGIQTISCPGLAMAYYNNQKISGPVDFSSLKYVYAERLDLAGTSSYFTLPEPFYATFYNAKNLTSVDLSGILTWGSTTTYEIGCWMFAKTGVETVDISNATKITFGSGMFSNCNKLTTVDCHSAQYIFGNSAFLNCTKLTDFITNPNGFDFYADGFAADGRYFFKGCTSLAKFPFEKVMRIYQGAPYLCEGCTALEKVKFKSLSIMAGYVTTGSGGLCYGFKDCTNLTELWFYALTTITYYSYKQNCFYQMLQNVNGCTVHFTKAIEAEIGSWPNVLSGFGGTNITVLFDVITSLEGVNSETYTRQEKDSTNTATAWVNNSVLYYTSGTTEPQVGDTIYSDAACTTAVTTISTIA